MIKVLCHSKRNPVLLLSKLTAECAHSSHGKLQCSRGDYLHQRCSYCHCILPIPLELMHLWERKPEGFVFFIILYFLASSRTGFHVTIVFSLIKLSHEIHCEVEKAETPVISCAQKRKRKRIQTRTRPWLWAVAPWQVAHTFARFAVGSTVVLST